MNQKKCFCGIVFVSNTKVLNMLYYFVPLNIYNRDFTQIFNKVMYFISFLWENCTINDYSTLLIHYNYITSRGDLCETN